MASSSTTMQAESAGVSTPGASTGQGRATPEPEDVARPRVRRVRNHLSGDDQDDESSASGSGVARQSKMSLKRCRSRRGRSVDRWMLLLPINSWRRKSQTWLRGGRARMRGATIRRRVGLRRRRQDSAAVNAQQLELSVGSPLTCPTLRPFVGIRGFSAVRGTRPLKTIRRSTPKKPTACSLPGPPWRCPDSRRVVARKGQEKGEVVAGG
jgi:hypothetical protein